MQSNMSNTKERTYQEILAFILEQGSKVTMSQRSISKQTGYSTSTIARTLDHLQSSNLIKIQKSQSQSTPDTIIYIGPRQIKRSVTEILNSILSVLRSLLTSISTRSTRIRYIDDEIPSTIDTTKVLLYKKLPNVDVDMIVLKRN